MWVKKIKRRMLKSRALSILPFDGSPPLFPPPWLLPEDTIKYRNGLCFWKNAPLSTQAALKCLKMVLSLALLSVLMGFATAEFVQLLITPSKQRPSTFSQEKNSIENSSSSLNAMNLNLKP